MRFKFSTSALLLSVKHMRTARFEFAALIILCLGTIAAVTWNDGKLVDFWSAIQPRDQRYTALAFTDPNNMPISLPYDNSLNFSFSVGNDEGTKTTYVYVVTVTDKTGTKEVTQGVVTIPATSKVVVPEKLSLARSSSPEAITVTLPAQSESIDFMLKGSAA